MFKTNSRYPVKKFFEVYSFLKVNRLFIQVIAFLMPFSSSSFSNSKVLTQTVEKGFRNPSNNQIYPFILIEQCSMR